MGVESGVGDMGLVSGEKLREGVGGVGQDSYRGVISCTIVSSR